jgi:transcription elongation factor GreB
MSRGFVKEEDQEEAPFIPPRAALPPGATNYVTPLGYQQLLDERELLEKKLAELNISDEKERRHAKAVLEGSLNLLNERIRSSRMLKPSEQPQGEVRFGAKVDFVILSGKQKGTEHSFKIVGVDEAEIKKHKIAFVAPVARALTGKKIGDKGDVRMGGEELVFQVIDISYS